MGFFGLLGGKAKSRKPAQQGKPKFKIGDRVAFRQDTKKVGTVTGVFSLSPQQLADAGFTKAPPINYKVDWDNGTRGVPEERQILKTNRAKNKIPNLFGD